MKPALTVAFVALVAACARPLAPQPQSAAVAPSPAPLAPRSSAADVPPVPIVPPPMVLQDYEQLDLSRLHVDAGVAETSIEQDPSAAGHRVLRVRYHCTARQPDCDIWQNVGSADWRGARALRFRIRTEKPLALSTSFIDGNGVGYTVHTDATRGGDWEDLVVPIDRYQPNQYYQPPDAKVGSPLDLEHVRAFGFCPLDEGPGSFAIDEIVLDR